MTAPLDAEEMLDAIQEAAGTIGGIELTPWEEDFLADMEDRLSDDRTLTPDQLEKLEEIYAKV